MFANKIHEEAHALMQSGDIQGSIALYTKAMEQDPKDCNLISDRAVAYLHLNEKENCFKDFDLALSIQPNYGYRYASRAFAKNHFGDIDGAVKDYEKAVEMDPEDAVAQNNLGLLLEQKGYKNAASERFKRADKLSKPLSISSTAINDSWGQVRAHRHSHPLSVSPIAIIND